MRGVIKKKISEKLSILVLMQGIKLSKNELSIFSEVVYYSANGSLAMDVQLAREIRAKLNISASLFDTAIHRLSEKKVIRKNGKSIIISPIYSKAESITELLIKFE